MRYVTEYKDMYTVDGRHFRVPYRVVLEDDFKYVTLEEFNQMSDYQRTRYIADLDLHEMCYAID